MAAVSKWQPCQSITQGTMRDSCTLRKLRACSSQSELRMILKLCESSACALFQYSCTPNTSSNAYVHVNFM